MTEPPFQRTKCGCSQCVACCKRQPAALIMRDVNRIVAFIAERQQCSAEIAFERFKAQVWASPGSLVKDLITGVTRRIGTITPRWDHKRKRCVFLSDDDRCTIHRVAPFGCSHFDTHMGFDEGNERSCWAVKQHTDPEYQALRNQLPMATHYKPFQRT